MNNSTVETAHQTKPTSAPYAGPASKRSANPSVPATVLNEKNKIKKKQIKWLCSLYIQKWSFWSLKHLQTASWGIDGGEEKRRAWFHCRGVELLEIKKQNKTKTFSTQRPISNVDGIKTIYQTANILFIDVNWKGIRRSSASLNWMNDWI